MFNSPGNILKYIYYIYIYTQIVPDLFEFDKCDNILNTNLANRSGTFYIGIWYIYKVN